MDPIRAIILIFVIIYFSILFYYAIWGNERESDLAKDSLLWFVLIFVFFLVFTIALSMVLINRGLTQNDVSRIVPLCVFTLIGTLLVFLILSILFVIIDEWYRRGNEDVPEQIDDCASPCKCEKCLQNE